MTSSTSGDSGLTPEAVRAIYNEKVRNEFGGSYEDQRWFRSSASRVQYSAMKRFIERIVAAAPSFDSYLEVGPGPGTWTQFFVEARPRASFDLVDISTEMIAPARERLAGRKTRFFEQDFLTFVPDRQYDFFFSSRAIEYMDKRRAAEVIRTCLRSGGAGVIITKQPRRGSIGRRQSSLHTDQIRSRDLADVLGSAGLDVQAVAPVVVHLPKLPIPTLDLLATRLLERRPVSSLTEPLVESYGISFTKP